jgi:hypothetical protein
MAEKDKPSDLEKISMNKGFDDYSKYKAICLYPLSGATRFNVYILRGLNNIPRQQLTREIESFRENVTNYREELANLSSIYGKKIDTKQFEEDVSLQEEYISAIEEYLTGNN